VLITDGENNAGEVSPESAAEIAARLGIRIYAIGVGTEGEVPIEYTDPATGKVHKGMFQSRFDFELLEQIATASGGRYFSAEDAGALNAVFRTIDSVETTERRVRMETHSRPFHRQLILIGLVLVLVDYLTRHVLLRELL
jgi:Ca-activated chloride channel family protein